MESVSYSLVKILFLLNGSTGVERQLNKNATLCAPDNKIMSVGDEGVSWMLVDDLKTVVLGRLQYLDHRLIDSVAYGAPIFGGLYLGRGRCGQAAYAVLW